MTCHLFAWPPTLLQCHRLAHSHACDLVFYAKYHLNSFRVQSYGVEIWPFPLLWLVTLQQCLSDNSVVFVALLYTDIFSHPNQTAIVGESVTISCHLSDNRPVNWWFRPSQDAVDSELCVNGRLVNGNHKWYTLNNNSLTIKSVTVDNSGLYTCGEDQGFGDRHTTWLTVLGEQ